MHVGWEAAGVLLQGLTPPPLFGLLFQSAVSLGGLDRIFSQHGAVQFPRGRLAETLGRLSLVISVRLMAQVSSTIFPFTLLVAEELEATSEPQPNVLKLHPLSSPFHPLASAISEHPPIQFQHF